MDANQPDQPDIDAPSATPAADCAAHRQRCARCTQCGYAIARLDGWHCPQCSADWRESPIALPRDLGIDHADLLRLPWRKFRGRGIPASRTPSCRGCGYPLRGMVGLTCPECGNDLANAHNHQPPLRWPVRRPLVMIIFLGLLSVWSIALAYGGVQFITFTRGNVLPWVDTAHIVARIQVRSGTFALMRIEAEASAWRFAWQRNATIPVHRSTAFITAPLDGQRVLPGQVAVPIVGQTFDSSGVRAILKSAGIDIARINDDEAGRIAALLSDIAAGRFATDDTHYLLDDGPHLTGRVDVKRTEQRAWWTAVPPGFAVLIVWLGGCRLLATGAARWYHKAYTLRGE